MTLKELYDAAKALLESTGWEVKRVSVFAGYSFWEYIHANDVPRWHIDVEAVKKFDGWEKKIAKDTHTTSPEACLEWLRGLLEPKPVEVA